MFGLLEDTKEFIAPAPREECLRKLEGALAAPPDRSFLATMGGGIPRVLGRTEDGLVVANLRLYPPALGRLFPIRLTADLREENGETKLLCRFSIRRVLAACMIIAFAAMSLTAIWLLVVSSIELFRGSPHSIIIGTYPSWFRFAVAPILLGLDIIVLVDAPRRVASDRRMVASFLWKVIRARPVPSPHEFRNGFEI